MVVTAEPRLTPAPAAPAVADGIEGRAVAALLACTARHGLAKTTLDDVAREAGCSRATLYRYFRGKRELGCVAVASESARVAEALRVEADRHDALEDAVVALIVAGARELREHAALQFVLAYEPELVLPHVTFSAGDDFLAAAGAALAPALVRHVGADRATRAGEWITRVVLAHSLSPLHPTQSIDLTDDATARALVREFVLPGLVGRSSQPTEPTRG
jgi:AcrR family transcriptional regulator